MKYCITARQTKEYLQKADEILVEWRDHDAILDILEINPAATIILHITDGTLNDKDWEQINEYYIMTKKQFKVMLTNLVATNCIKYGIPFFFSNPVYTAWEANAAINLGVCAIYIAGELAHQLDYVSTLNVEIRVWPNKALAPFDYKPLYGSWFRPEDMDKLDMIDVCDFTRRRDNAEEQALFRIYAEQKAWPGELNMIVKDIQNDKIVNRMIPPEFQERRSNCHLRCQSGGYCHFCDTVTYLANPKVLRPVKEKLKND